MTFSADRGIETRFGLIDVEVLLREDGRLSAELANPHPRLAAIAGAFGAAEDQAVERLREAVEQFGSSWPRPPASDRREWSPQDPVAQVNFEVDGAMRTGFATVYTATEVYVAWQASVMEDRRTWLPAAAVQRV